MKSDLKQNKNDSLMMYFALVALVMSVVAAGVTYFSVSHLVNQITGLGITATVNLTVESVTQVNFSVASINFGSGRVNSGSASAFLDTQTGTVVRGNWTAVTAPLILENTGTVNVTVNLTAGQTAAQFLGGTNPSYKWNVTSNSTTGGCFLNATGQNSTGTPGIFVNPNTTATVWCVNLTATAGFNALKIHFNLTVPSDSKTGALSDNITATGYSGGA